MMSWTSPPTISTGTLKWFLRKASIPSSLWSSPMLGDSKHCNFFSWFPTWMETECSKVEKGRWVGIVERFKVTRFFLFEGKLLASFELTHALSAAVSHRMRTLWLLPDWSLIMPISDKLMVTMPPFPSSLVAFALSNFFPFGQTEGWCSPLVWVHPSPWSVFNHSLLGSSLHWDNSCPWFKQRLQPFTDLIKASLSAEGVALKNGHLPRDFAPTPPSLGWPPTFLHWGKGQTTWLDWAPSLFPLFCFLSYFVFLICVENTLSFLCLSFGSFSCIVFCNNLRWINCSFTKIKSRKTSLFLFSCSASVRCFTLLCSQIQLLSNSSCLCLLSLLKQIWIVV